MSSALQHLVHASRLRQFVKFCLVGGSGVVVDMAVLHLLAVALSWNVTLSKVCSAEAAMLSNFLWNEVWTFGGAGGRAGEHRGLARRLWRFHAICGAGIGLAVLLLHLFHSGLGINLYLANLLAIGLVTLWNFWLNALFNWRVTVKEG
jgi:dolichol-phosphate mannosyltransferase